jgi:hypothetical protein
MLENLKRINPAMAIVIITQFNTFIQADISKKIIVITPIYTKMGKKPTVFLGGGKFYGEKRQ